MLFASVEGLTELRMGRTGLGIYKRKKENTHASTQTRKHTNTHSYKKASTQKRTHARKHTRKHALVQESIHKKKNLLKKTRTRPRKKELGQENKHSYTKRINS